MEIEFNTSSISRREVAAAITKREAAAPVTDTTSFTASTSLEDQLGNVPAARVDKVALARSVMANPNYPPQELLDRIAVLLAMHNLK